MSQETQILKVRDAINRYLATHNKWPTREELKDEIYSAPRLDSNDTASIDIDGSIEDAINVGIVVENDNGELETRKPAEVGL